MVMAQQRRTEEVTRDVSILPYGLGDSTASIPNKVYVGYTRSKCEGMVLHPGATRHISQNDYCHSYSLLERHEGGGGHTQVRNCWLIADSSSYDRVQGTLNEQTGATSGQPAQG
jgi:hypothetical protein